MADVTEFEISDLPGGEAIVLKRDFLVSLKFVDSDDPDVVLADYTGANAIKASEILGLMPTDDLREWVRQVTPGVLMEAEKRRRQAEEETEHHA